MDGPVFLRASDVGNPFKVGVSAGLACDGGSCGQAQKAVPLLRDFNGDGLLDVATFMDKSSAFEVKYWENTGTASLAAYTQRTGAASPMDTLALPSTAGSAEWPPVPSMGDLDGDGDDDLLFSLSFDELDFYTNPGSNANPVFTKNASPNLRECMLPLHPSTPFSQSHPHHCALPPELPPPPPTAPRAPLWVAPPYPHSPQRPQVRAQVAAPTGTGRRAP